MMLSAIKPVTLKDVISEYIDKRQTLVPITNVQTVACAQPLIYLHEVPLLWVDMEHQLQMQIEQVSQVIDMARGTNTLVMVRVPSYNSDAIQQTLDWGADVIMIPKCTVVSQVQQAIGRCKYQTEQFPDAQRGVAAVPANNFGKEREAIDTANDRLGVVIQIEDDRLLPKVEEVANTPGVDALFVGPADLSWSLRVYNQMESTPMDQAVEKTVQAARGAEIPVFSTALYGNGDDAFGKMKKKGFGGVCYFGDVGSTANNGGVPSFFSG